MTTFLLRTYVLMSGEEITNDVRIANNIEAPRKYYFPEQLFENKKERAKVNALLYSNIFELFFRSFGKEEIFALPVFQPL